jgi:hypothetical protein
MKKLILMFALIVQLIGLFGVNAQETRINNPWVKGRIKFQNGYFLWDSVSKGLKTNGGLWLQNELWINAFRMKDSSGYIVFNYPPRFPAMSSWILDGYIVSMNGSKILDSTITFYKLHPDLVNKIFQDTLSVRGLTNLYNIFRNRFDLMHDFNGKFYPSIFSGIIKYNAGQSINDPGTIYLKTSGYLDTAGGQLDIKARSLDSSKLADTSITASKIKNASIDSNKLANGAITNSKIKDASINPDKLNGNKIKGAYLGTDTLFVSTYIFWSTDSLASGSFVERLPGTGPDSIGYIFPRGGRLLTATIRDLQGHYKTQTLDPYTTEFSYDDFLTLFYTYSNGEGQIGILRSNSIGAGILYFSWPIDNKTTITIELYSY